MGKYTRERLAFCHYYKGEDKEPAFDDQNKRMIWFYERVYTEGDEATDEALLAEYPTELMRFSEHDGVPLALKALLFNRYAKGHYSLKLAVEPFKEFYKKYYV